MGTSNFLKMKNTKIIKKCFGGKMYLIIMNRKTIETNFIPDRLF